MTSFAMIFPGQGSQSVGMLTDLWEQHGQVRDTFSQASDILGQDLWAVASRGPEEALNETQCTQPLMLTAGVAVWRAWRANDGPMPMAMAGHSLGEYTAMVCSDGMDFAPALRLVVERARVMQSAVPLGVGAMAAIIGLDDAGASALCARAAQEEVLEPVNFNCPGQVVVAGHSTAVDRAIRLAKDQGAKMAVLLPVSVPSHCSLMREAAQAFGEFVAATPLRTPRCAVYHNADAAYYKEPVAIRDALIRQLYSPVRWGATIHAMAHEGAKILVECGPGKVMTALIKRIDRQLAAYPTHTGVALAAALLAVSETPRILGDHRHDRSASCL